MHDQVLRAYGYYNLLCIYCSYQFYHMHQLFKSCPYYPEPHKLDDTFPLYQLGEFHFHPRSTGISTFHQLIPLDLIFLPLTTVVDLYLLHPINLLSLLVVSFYPILKSILLYLHFYQ